MLMLSVTMALMDQCTVVGVHHVQLAMPVGGEAAAKRFYADLLGLPEVPKPAELANEEARV